jgi:PKD repeat protein
MRLAAAASDPEGGPVTIAWDFADGTTGSGAAVEHTWRNPGHYRITATARDAQGQAATAAMTVEVDDPAGRVPDGPATTVPGLFWEHAYNNRPHIWRNGRPTSVPADAPRPPPGGASGGGVVPPAADPADAHDAILSFLTLDRAQRGVIAMPIPERTSSRSFRWVTAYTGYLEAPADGAYDFELPCFAAGQLWIGGRLVCFRPELRYNNGDCRAPGRITLRKGLHSVRIMHAWNAFIGTKPELQPMLEPRWRTPGAAVMAAIPAAAWQRPTSMPELVLDLHPGTVRPGERLTASVLRSRAGAQAALATATWDFGDGSTATGLEAGHAYDRPGEYRMTVRLRNDRGAEDVLTRSILVGERMPAISAGRLAPGLDYRYYKSDDSFNRMPDFASWRPTAAGVVAEPDITSADQPDFFAFQFEGYLHVPSGGVHRFKLDCDDGGILRLDGKVVVDNSIITPEIQNATGDVGLDAGLHRLQIDYFEGIIAQRINLLVQEPGETDWKPVPRSWYWRDDGDGIDHRPLVSATIPARAPAGTPVRLDAGASSDPDGDPVTVTWDLGDGRILEGAVVEALWRNPGTYPVTATVRAHRGEAVGTAARITVAASSNRPPTVRIDAPVVTGDRALPFTASAVTADPDGDPVVCTWDFGDGARAVGATAARLLGGGRWLVTVTAEDGRGGIAYATAMVGIAMPKERMIGAYLTNVRGRGRLTGPSSVAGYLPQAGWNAINEKGPTPLTDAAGGSSGAVIRLLGVATRRSDEFTWTGGTSGEVGLHGTIGLPSRKESPDGATVVEGIPFARYDVLVGLAGLPTNSKRPVTIQVNDAVRVLYPLDGWKDAYVLSRATDAKDASPGTNVAEFTGVTGATLRITGPFSWFQIVERP